MVYLIPTLDERIARHKGVKAEVYAEGREISTRAQTLLNAHRAEGNAKITLTRLRKDTLVSLVDPAALSIEFGRGEYTRSDGVTVGAMDGLYIMHQAAGL